MSESSSTPRSLPARPNLEYLRKLAKDKLKELQRTHASARLADAQLAVARDHGFASWRRLRAHLDRVSPAAGASGETAWPEALVQDFFGAIRRGDEAALQQMLQSEPGLANARAPQGSTAVSVAAEPNRTGVGVLLMSRGADPELTYSHSAHTALSWAVTVGSLDAARALVQQGVALDLFCAAGMGDARAVESFFEPDGRLKPGASRTGSTRFASDG